MRCIGAATVSRARGGAPVRSHGGVRRNATLPRRKTVKQGVDEVVVEMEQVWPRPIDELSYVDIERLWWSDAVAR